MPLQLDASGCKLLAEADVFTIHGAQQYGQVIVRRTATPALIGALILGDETLRHHRSPITIPRVWEETHPNEYWSAAFDDKIAIIHHIESTRCAFPYLHWIAVRDADPTDPEDINPYSQPVLIGPHGSFTLFGAMAGCVDLAIALACTGNKFYR